MAAVATAAVAATACAPLDCLPADVVATALAFLAFADAARLSAASEFWSRSVSGHAATVCISRTAPPYLPRLRRYLKIRELQFSTPHRLPDAAGSLHGIHSHVNSHMEGLTELLAARPGIESLTLSDGLGAGLYGAQALARHFRRFGQPAAGATNVEAAAGAAASVAEPAAAAAPRAPAGITEPVPVLALVELALPAQGLGDSGLAVLAGAMRACREGAGRLRLERLDFSSNALTHAHVRELVEAAGGG